MGSAYLCSPIKLSELNRSIAECLERYEISVYLPETHTNQTGSPDQIFRSNVEAINGAKIVVAVLKDYGRDFGFEIGYAYGLGKKIIGYAENEQYKADPMIYGAIDTIVSTREELVSWLKILLG